MVFWQLNCFNEIWWPIKVASSLDSVPLKGTHHTNKSESPYFFTAYIYFHLLTWIRSILSKKNLPFVYEILSSCQIVNSNIFFAIWESLMRTLFISVSISTLGSNMPYSLEQERCFSLRINLLLIIVFWDTRVNHFCLVQIKALLQIWRSSVSFSQMKKMRLELPRH